MAVDAPRRGRPLRQSKQRSTRMKVFGGHPRPPGFGHLPRGLAVAAVAAVTVVPLAASAAAVAQATHNAGADAGHAEQTASFGGKDGKYPGGIHALTDCPGNCGGQLVHSAGSAAASYGAFTGYVSVGSSSATQDLSIDDKGR